MKLMRGIFITMGIILVVSSIVAFAVAGFADGYYLAIGGFFSGCLMVLVGCILGIGET